MADGGEVRVLALQVRGGRALPASSLAVNNFSILSVRRVTRRSDRLHSPSLLLNFTSVLLHPTPRYDNVGDVCEWARMSIVLLDTVMLTQSSQRLSSFGGTAGRTGLHTPSLTLPTFVFEQPAVSILLPVVLGSAVGYATRRKCTSCSEGMVDVVSRGTP